MADKGHTELPWSLNPHHPRLINGGPNHREVAKTSFGADGELAENTANANLIVTAVNTYPAVEGLVKALEGARQFITNGIELGYIRMPDSDTPDPAHQRLPQIEAALSRFRSLQNGGAE
jgi:hypothetical protein